MEVIIVRRERDGDAASISLFADTPNGESRARELLADVIANGLWTECHGHGLLACYTAGADSIEMTREVVLE